MTKLTSLYFIFKPRGLKVGSVTFSQLFLEKHDQGNDIIFDFLYIGGMA